MTESRGFSVSPSTVAAPISPLITVTTTTTTSSTSTVPVLDWHSRTMILLGEAYRWEKAQITSLVATGQLPGSYARLLLQDLRRIYAALACEVRKCDEADAERQRVTSEHLDAMLMWSDSALCLEADPRHFDARLVLTMGDCAVGESGCLIPLTLAGVGYCAQRKLNNHRRQRVQVLLQANEALEQAKRQQLQIQLASASAVVAVATDKQQQQQQKQPLLLDADKDSMVGVCEVECSSSEGGLTSSWDSEENTCLSECDSDESCF